MTGTVSQGLRVTGSMPLPDSAQRARKRGVIRRLMRKSPGVANSVIGAVLLAVLGMLITQVRAVDAAAHADVVSLLRQLKQIDAEWNVDVLRVKAGLSTSYDPAASPLPLLHSLEAALRRRPGEAWHGHDAGSTGVLQLLERNKQVMDQKIALIERFKAQHAILRNASRYLPAAAAEVLAGLDAVAPAAKAAVWPAVDEVLTQVLVYVNAPDAVAATKATDALARLQRLAATLPPQAAERVAGFSVHATTMLKQEQLGTQLLSEMMAVPTARAMDDLGDAHAQEYGKLLAAQQNERWLLVGYGVLLLLLLAHVARRQYRSRRLLIKTSTDLQRANARLQDMQVHLVQSERMSALGQMMAGLAHEIDSALVAVKVSVDLLGGQAAPLAGLVARSQEFVQMMRDPLRNHDREQFNREFRSLEAATREVAHHGLPDAAATLLHDSLGRIAGIVASLKDFSRPDDAKAGEFPVHDSLESALALARHLMKNRVQVHKEYGDVPMIHGSSPQISLVFLKLLMHAAAATPAGRTEPGMVTLRTRMEGRDMLRVEIHDDGAPIPDDVLPRIFDPAFTTADSGPGTGMGLSVPFRIVQEHGGRILVDTGPGTGTTFSVLLPVRPRRKAAQTVAGALASA